MGRARLNPALFNELKVYLKCNEGVGDYVRSNITENNFDFEAFDGADPAWSTMADGRVGVHFNGDGGYIEADAVALTGTEFTGIVYYKRIGTGLAPGANTWQALMTSPHGNAGRNRLLVSSTGTMFEAQFGTDVDGDETIISPSDLVYNGEDNVYGYRYDGERASIYFNGREVNSGPLTGNPLTGVVETFCGAYTANYYWCNGVLGFALLWDRALSMREIRQVYEGRRLI